MRRLYFVVCPACRIQFEVREVRPYTVAEGPQGEDEVSFFCPRCHQDGTSPVRERACERGGVHDLEGT